jgi:hypothetical protein
MIAAAKVANKQERVTSLALVGRNKSQRDAITAQHALPKNSGESSEGKITRGALVVDDARRPFAPETSC